MYNKKGTMELSIILFGLVFTLIMNIFLSFALNSGIVTDYDAEATIEEYVNSELDLGITLSVVITGLLWVISVFFGIFSINFVSFISVLPTFMISIYSFFNALLCFSIIMYFVDKIWIG